MIISTFAALASLALSILFAAFGIQIGKNTDITNYHLLQALYFIISATTFCTSIIIFSIIEFNDQQKKRKDMIQ